MSRVISHAARAAPVLVAVLALLGAGRADALACAATPPLCPLGYSCNAGQCAPTLICVPYGVGGAYASGPPTFWQAAATTGWGRFNGWIDDPRWGSDTFDPLKGSCSITHGDSTQEVVQFRALHNDDPAVVGPALYMQWWVKFTPSGVSTNRIMWVGMGPAGGNHLLVRVNLTSASPTVTNGNSGSNLSAHAYLVDATGSYGTPLDNDPAWQAANPWMNNIRSWVDVLEKNVPATGNWAYAIEVPTGVNLGTTASPVTLGNDFTLWYEVKEVSDTAGVSPSIATWPRPYRDPVTNQQVSFEVTGTIVEQAPAPSTWGNFHLHANGADSACTAGGIEILPGDISVQYPGQTDPGHIGLDVDNTFTATPTNLTTDPINTGDLHARFRIADWGTQPNTTEADPSTGTWITVGNLGDVTQSPPPAQIAPNATWTLQGVWHPTQSSNPEFYNGTRSPHECVQVELSGPNLVFMHSSNFVNLSIGTATTFTDAAVVDVEGLPSIGGQARDVYLYVEARNMPEFSFTPASVGTVTVGVGGSGGKGGGVDVGRTARTPAGLSSIVTTNPPPPVNKSHTILEAYPGAPAYVVHAYYDTGRKVKLGGTVWPVLRPLNAFGYLIQHQGGLEGWNHSLRCNPGLVCQDLGGDWYRVTLPQNGKGTIVNTIEAIDPKRFSIGLHAGVAIPHGSFASTHATGFGVRIDGEYFLQPNHAVALDLGYDRFGGKSGGADTSTYRASAAYRYYPMVARLRPFVMAGLGVVKLDPGNSAGEGFVGVGGQFLFTHALAGELTYQLHGTTNSNPKVSWSDVQLGVRYRF